MMWSNLSGLIRWVSRVKDVSWRLQEVSQSGKLRIGIDTFLGNDLLSYKMVKLQTLSNTVEP